jgi:hypothetical protein
MQRLSWKNRLGNTFAKTIPGFSFGALASASFLISLLSGVMIALFYDPTYPYHSITMWLLYNPWVSVMRNLHYWSAQFFLGAVIIHCWGFLRKRHFQILRPGIWFRLTLALIFAFLVMFTGFLLKGDDDSRQASMIFRRLLETLPFVGRPLSVSVLGPGDSYLLPYVHHIATTSIILIIIVREHARRLRTGKALFLLSLVPAAALSLFLIPPLHDGYDPLVKGPWYFAGLQELLHWTARPMLVWPAILLFFIVIFSLRYLNEKYARICRISLLFMGSAYIGLSLAGIFFRGENWQWTWPGQGKSTSHYVWSSNALSDHAPGIIITDSVKGKESCLHCHDRFTGLGAAHSPLKIGCYSCHGGNRFSLNKNIAHKNMRLIPGNMDDMKISCGSASCHTDIIPRIDSSLMTRLSGLIAVDRWVFDEALTPDEAISVAEVGDSPSGLHLKNLCLSCHLGGVKKDPGAADEKSRGGGCLACHLNYSAASANQRLDYLKAKKNGSLRDFAHPSVDIKVSDDHCFGCHSRSGRISLSYQGWAEMLESDSVLKGKRIRRLADGRILEFVAEDLHHKGGMACTDCHTAREIMGDGQRYRHKEEAVTLRCTDCHSDQPIKTAGINELDYETEKIRKLWGWDTQNSYHVKRKDGAVILGSKVNDGNTATFFARYRKREMMLKPPARVCLQGKAHKNLSCSACHSGWAPRCLGCHTSFNEKVEGVDLLNHSTTEGRWEEAMAGFTYGLPTLGVRIENNYKVIIPVVPGMIMSLEKGGDGGSDKSFHRLYAPLEPHTTQKAGRDCKSCHNNSIALGYGEGRLEYRAFDKVGKWYFTASFAKSEEDGLPQDAWTGFLCEGKVPYSTRTHVRPFTLKEQLNMLRAGACLNCHEGSSQVMTAAMEDFQAVIRKAGKKCLLPGF